jgi:hypothetical protein
MKVKWKIMIGVLALFAVLVSVSSLFILSKKMEPPAEMAPSYLTSSDSVDSLLDEMEFGPIAFNTPTNINIDDSPQVHLILSLAETV